MSNQPEVYGGIEFYKVDVDYQDYIATELGISAVRDDRLPPFYWPGS